MKAVICGGIKYSSLEVCAESFGVDPDAIRSAIETTGKFSVFGYPVRFVEEVTPAPVRGRTVLRPGYIRHRLGAWVG